MDCSVNGKRNVLVVELCLLGCKVEFVTCGFVIPIEIVGNGFESSIFVVYFTYSYVYLNLISIEIIASMHCILVS